MTQRQTKANRQASLKKYRESNKGKATIAAYNESDDGKATIAAYSTSELVRRRNYLHNHRGCNPTQLHWEHYRDATHCECCHAEFGHGSSYTGKCQDHNHDTNELRGVICRSCNVTEGYAKTPERAYEVACYMASNTPLTELIKGLL
jgi:hypothetical protein